MRWLLAVIVGVSVSLIGCGSSSTRVDERGCSWTGAQLGRLYSETEACVGVTAPMPAVIFKPFSGSFGLYSVAGGEVWINTSPGWDLFRTCELEAQTLRREYVHHLLWVNFGDLTHDSPLFGVCGV